MQVTRRQGLQGLMAGAAVAAMPTLVRAATTRTARQNGNINSASTWWGGTAPADDDSLIIPYGITVTVSTAAHATIDKIDVYGTLKLVNGADLSVDTIRVYSVGNNIGSFIADTFPAGGNINVLFTDRTTVDNTADMPTRGLVAEGLVQITGTAKTPFAEIASWDGATTSTIYFVDPGNDELGNPIPGVPVDWEVGDRIVLPGNVFHRYKASDNPPFSFSTEVFTINDISNDTVNRVYTITLGKENDPLTPDSTSRDAHKVPASPEINQIVVNLTRDITFKSANTATAERAHFRVQAHDNGDGTMTAPDAATLQGAAFVDMGRTNKAELITHVSGTNPVGLYPVHLHHAMGMMGDEHFITNCAVEGSPGWGIVNHNSRAMIVDNVVYNVDGAGIVAERGDETGCICGNAVVNMNGTDHKYERDRTYLGEPERVTVADFAFEGVGIYVGAPMVEVMDNVCACCDGPGLFYGTVGLESAPAVDPNYNTATAVRLDRDTVENEMGITLGALLPYWNSFGPDALTGQSVRPNTSTNNTFIGCFIGLKTRYVQNRNAVLYHKVKVPGGTLDNDMIVPTNFDEAQHFLDWTPTFKAWNCESGAMLSYSARPVLNGFYVGCDVNVAVTDWDPAGSNPNPGSTNTWIGIQADRANDLYSQVKNGEVENYPIGILANRNTVGDPQPVISGMTYTNITLDDPVTGDPLNIFYFDFPNDNN
jgi:hypothetical protein